MKSIYEIKTELAIMEKSDIWIDITDYLYSEWLQQKENGDLCILIIQQMIGFLLEIDRLPHPVTDGNCSQNNRKRFEAVLYECVDYGLEHCLSSKYFVWQICYYLLYMSTYYYLYVNFNNDDHVKVQLTNLLHYAGESFPDSMLFQQIRESIMNKQYDEWKASLTENEKMLLKKEVEQFCLQNNGEDMNKKFFFSCQGG